MGQLQLKASYKFLPQDFPGYTHRRTTGFKEGLSAACNEEIISHNPRTCEALVVLAGSSCAAAMVSLSCALGATAAPPIEYGGLPTG